MTKTVETIFGDNRFHSRLAARWAVFFDLIGIEYEYRSYSYKLTDLGEQIWTPDFYLPGFEQSAIGEFCGVFIQLFEKKPGAHELKPARHFSGCVSNQTVYAFYGELARQGIRCCSDDITKEMKDSSACCLSEFAQCPFCGRFYIEAFTDNRHAKRYVSHGGCVAECEFSSSYDIDECFLDYRKDQQVLPAPTCSPMLDLARHVGRTIRFEARDALDKLEGVRLAIEVLRSAGNFASNAVLKSIADHACKLSHDPRCPRYEEPWYVRHITHMESGSTDPCPCSECNRVTKTSALHMDLENMPSPGLKM
jgi:hypothetical protein